jgi:hypothetical protein
MTRSNCLFFAIGRYWRYRGHIIVRPSHFGWWPHFMWSSDLLTFEEFEPVADKRQSWLPPVIFRGYVRIFVPE